MTALGYSIPSHGESAFGPAATELRFVDTVVSWLFPCHAKALDFADVHTQELNVLETLVDTDIHTCFAPAAVEVAHTLADHLVSEVR